MNNIKKLKVSICSYVGNYRNKNQDNFYVNAYFNEYSLDLIKYKFNSGYPCVACLYDGMGGMESGEIASLSAAKLSSILYDKAKASELTEAEVERFYLYSNDVLNKYKEDHCLDFGTTASICLLYEKNIVVSNIGDSKIYLFKDSVLYQLSVEHNDANISANISISSRLSQYLGCNNKEFRISPYVSSIENNLKKNDCILLCSDGVSSSVENSEISNILNEKHKNPAEVLVDRAMKNGSKDNATAIVLSF